MVDVFQCMRPPDQTQSGCCRAGPGRQAFAGHQIHQYRNASGHHQQDTAPYPQRRAKHFIEACVQQEHPGNQQREKVFVGQLAIDDAHGQGRYKPFVDHAHAPVKEAAYPIKADASDGQQ